MAGDSLLAVTLRKKTRQAFIKISADLEDKLSSGETPFSVAELLEVLARVDAKQNEVNALMKIDAATAMGLNRGLGLPENQKLLRNAVFLLKDTGDESKVTRRTALSELQRALAQNNNLIETKCRVWEAIK